MTNLASLRQWAVAIETKIQNWKSLSCLQYFFQLQCHTPVGHHGKLLSCTESVKFVYVFLLKASIYSYSAFSQGVY